MVGQRTPRWLLGGVAGLVAVLCTMVAAQEASSAPDGSERATKRALVIIDDGVVHHEACVMFSGDLSGIEALQLAGAELTLSGFGGLGSAVCAINGTGCPAGSCLTCHAPDYWQYFRADAGDSVATPSAGGASTNTVDNGDVEVWMWGSHSDAPGVPSVTSACGGGATTTTAARPPATPTSAPRPPAGPTTLAGGAVTPPTTVAVTTTTGGDATPSTTGDDTATADTTESADGRGDTGDAEDADGTGRAGTDGGADPDANDDAAGDATGDGELASVVPGSEDSAGGTAGVGALAALAVIGGVVAYGTWLRRRGSP